MRYFYDHELQIELEEEQILDCQDTLRRVIDDLYPDRWINNTQKRLSDDTVRFFIEADKSLHDTLIARGFKEVDNGTNT
jgi:hypothetical protein